jgi:DNA polymerase-3 subunit delta
MSRPGSGVWLLMGPEAGQRDEFIATEIRALRAASGGEPEVHKRYYPENKIGELVGLLSTPSLFSQARAAVLYGIDLVKAKDEAAMLTEFAADPPPDSLLFLVTEATRLDGVEGGKIEKALEGRKKVFWELYESDKRRWAQRFVQSRGLSIEQDAIELFLELSEGSTDAMGTCLAALCAYKGEGARISLTDVEDLVAHGREESAFTIFDRIADGKLPQALEALGKYLFMKSGDAAQLLSGLSLSFRRMLAWHRMRDSGAGAEEAWLRSGVKGKRMGESYARAARRYQREDVERIVAEINRADARLRGGMGALERQMLEILVYGIIVGKGRLARAEYNMRAAAWP